MSYPFNQSQNKKIHVIGGGTVFHVRPHLALSAVAYGTTARKIAALCANHPDNKLDVELHLTKMANPHGENLGEGPENVQARIEWIVQDPSSKIVFFNPAMIDFSGKIGEDGLDWSFHGKYGNRLNSREGPYTMKLMSARKIVNLIRKDRKDIFLVTFKTTCKATEQEMYIAGLDLLKRSSSNLVLVNDVYNERRGKASNMIITPEEAAYHVTDDRDQALEDLVDMTLLRSHLTFTRSTVVSGESVPWSDSRVPSTLRTVVNHCIERGAYKVFNGATVGHFAVKLENNLFLTSKRKTNFNDLQKTGLVLVRTDGPDDVVAYGSKPSVGGQSQRIVFSDHPEADCIVHFHCPLKANSTVPVVSQREFECGSHECGNNTSKGLKKFGNLKAVMLDNHGPNIVFHHSIDPGEVIRFIEDEFDLSGKTGGYSTQG